MIEGCRSWGDAQGCELYTCESLRGRGREMAASSDAIKQMLSQGLLPTSSANVRGGRTLSATYATCLSAPLDTHEQGYVCRE